MEQQKGLRGEADRKEEGDRVGGREEEKEKEKERKYGVKVEIWWPSQGRQAGALAMAAGRNLQTRRVKQKKKKKKKKK